MVRRTEGGKCELQCTSKQDIMIRRIRTSSKYVVVAPGDDPHSIAGAVIKDPFTMIIPAEAQANLPIVVTDGTLIEKDASTVVPFVIAVSWRKTRSMWFPQVPALIFSSIRALRRLEGAKNARPGPQIA
jgi:hypothetical protein